MFKRLSAAFLVRIMAAVEAIENAPPAGSWAVAKDLIAGTIGGWAQVFAAQPFDTVKV